MPDLDNPDYLNSSAATGSDNPLLELPFAPVSGSDNPPARRRGAKARQLSAPQERILTDYAAGLAGAPLDDNTRRTYISQVRGFLAWLEVTDHPGDPLTERYRDGAARDYRSHLQTVLRRRPATINLALAAVADFYVRSGLGEPRAARLELPQTAPKALSEAEHLRWVREVQRRPIRNQVLAYLGRYAGLRIGERVALNVSDIALSSRKCLITVRRAKGGKWREIPGHPLLHESLTRWVYDERPAWPGAADTDALLLNARGQRLGSRGATKILDDIAETAGVAEEYTSHVDRHGFATELIRDKKVDLVLVAELLGHARLEDTRRYTLPSADEKAAAVALLAIDQ